ncbi:MAG: rod shape-determining protein MreC, partial [Rikenellaceae bacterium]
KNKSSATSEDYFIQSRAMGGIAVFFSVAATWWSAFAFLGSNGYFYTTGPMYWTAFAWNVLFGIMYFGVGKKIWYMGKLNNYITLNKGSEDGVTPKMSVISGNSIVGYVVSVSPHFSIVLSAISKEFKTSGMFKKDQAICLIFWDGLHPKRLSFTEASKYSAIHIGDTIVTTSFSLLFPSNIDVGTVETIENGNRAFISGTIKPFTDFEKLKYVSIVEHSLMKESHDLESKTIGEDKDD